MTIGKMMSIQQEFVSKEKENNMKIGIIGYGSMGKMILEKISESKAVENKNLYIANRAYEKIEHLTNIFNVCRTNIEIAKEADIIFVCVRPGDIKAILNEIKSAIKDNTLLVSLNGSVTFELMEKVTYHKLAKVIPSVTAEINQSQTLVCYNELVSGEDKGRLENLLKCMGNVIELPENEIGMGSELVSCMPGFIAAIFDVISKSAKSHTSLPDEQIVQMLLRTMSATGNLMLEKDFSFDEVVERVATKGGITEEGTKVIYEMLPEVADKMFEKTLEKRRLTTQNVKESFDA